MRTWIIGLVAALALVYGLGSLVIYLWMHRPPEEFARGIARLPMPVVFALPFQPLWMRARAGPLQLGNTAPDFDLARLDKSGRVRLSEYRGHKAVALVFGSYT